MRRGATRAGLAGQRFFAKIMTRAMDARGAMLAGQGLRKFSEAAYIF
ncbi:MAG: hypothetical protein LBB09_02485 [Rickettsiales bacterium]|nr:hypothetical protein [Rickettsiales bacterium]